jgi:hypothetical protein
MRYYSNHLLVPAINFFAVVNAFVVANFEAEFLLVPKIVNGLVS